MTTDATTGRLRLHLLTLWARGLGAVAVVPVGSLHGATTVRVRHRCVALGSAGALEAWLAALSQAALFGGVTGARSPMAWSLGLRVFLFFCECVNV